MPARGRYWIEPESGRVTRTQLWLNTRGHGTGRQIEVNVAVDYARDPGLDLWVPVEMRERYTAVDGSRLETTAAYSNYRRFRVNARMRTPR